uniref:CXXC-type zinc finger protein 1 n=1 Tax=Angiostrongylus cantonensis TaxID=6313 RepID=A0A0K0CXA4_ANGCA
LDSSGCQTYCKRATDPMVRVLHENILPCKFVIILHGPGGMDGFIWRRHRVNDPLLLQATSLHIIIAYAVIVNDEPDCVKPAREDSKYCSDECGIKLAKVRSTILFFDIVVLSHDSHMVNCTVCGMETTGRQLPKHVERCFVRSEKQTSFGTATPVNNLFCEAYNKANNTYCKRVRVICAEHYKGELENELQVCAYPKAWSAGKSLTFEEMFEHGADLLKDQGFCCAPRKDCVQHHRWIQALVGTIECERMNLLTRLDELLERRKTVSVGCSTRGDVISLLNFVVSGRSISKVDLFCIE